MCSITEKSSKLKKTKRNTSSCSTTITVVCNIHTVFCLILILASLYFLKGLMARWDWPFTWWTDQLLSFGALTLLVGLSDP